MMRTLTVVLLTLSMIFSLLFVNEQIISAVDQNHLLTLKPWSQGTAQYNNTILSSTMATCRSLRILFVGGSNPLGAQDAQLIDDLAIFEHTITVRSDAGVTIFDAIGKDLIIISESVEPGEIGTLFRYVPVPILTWEGWLQDDLGMTARGNSDTDARSADVNQLTAPLDKDEGAYGEMVGETKIRVIKPEHPLAAGYSGIVQTTNNSNNRFHWGKPNENATIVATAQNEASRAMLYSYDGGDRMVDLMAPARRVFLHNATALDLTADGLVLFLTAVHWTQGCLNEPGPDPTETPTAISTPTATATATVPPLLTATHTPPELPTSTATATAIATVTTTATVTPTNTATSTPTNTPTNRPATSPTATPLTPTATTTTVPATVTPTPPPAITLTATPTATLTAGPTATTVVERTDISIEKRDLLFIDGDENGVVSTGDTLLYTIVIENRGPTAITELQLDDTPDGLSQLLAGSVQTSQGTVIVGNQSGDSSLQIRLERLTGGAAAQVTFQVEILPAVNGNAVGQLQNQATLRYTDSNDATPGGQQVILSDDPDTSTPGDSTTTPLNVGGQDKIQQIYLPIVTR